VEISRRGNQIAQSIVDALELNVAAVLCVGVAHANSRVDTGAFAKDTATELDLTAVKKLLLRSDFASQIG
jgi:hypothetical protein